MKSSKSFIRRVVVAAALALAPVTASFAIPTLSFASGSGSLHPAGSAFSIDLLGSGFTDLYGYQVSITFNPAIVRVLSVTEGPFLQTAGSTFFDGGTIDNTSGTVSFVFDTLISSISGATGSGVLATIDLAALAFGSTTLSLTDVVAVDSLVNDITVTVQPIVLAVAEPATISLILLAAGGGLLIGRRRTATVRP